MINETKIIRESIKKIYENELNTSRNDYVIFFKRPLIRKGYMTIRDIWKKGGKTSDVVCKKNFIDKKKDIYFICLDILNDQKYHMFLKVRHWDRDLPKDILRGLYFLLKGYGVDKETNQEKEFDTELLEQLYEELNSNFFQLFFKSILDFKRKVLKQGNNNYGQNKRGAKQEQEHNDSDIEDNEASWNDTYLHNSTR